MDFLPEQSQQPEMPLIFFLFLPQERGRWGSLHVCIAWKIYYHEQRKVGQIMTNQLAQMNCCKDNMIANKLY